MEKNENLVLKMNLLGGMVNYLSENLTEENLYNFVLEEENFKEFCKVFGKLVS
jgi:hypothetical protein